MMDCVDHISLWACLWEFILVSLADAGRTSPIMSDTIPWVWTLDPVSEEGAQH